MQYVNNFGEIVDLIRSMERKSYFMVKMVEKLSVNVYTMDLLLYSESMSYVTNKPFISPVRLNDNTIINMYNRTPGENLWLFGDFLHYIHMTMLGYAMIIQASNKSNNLQVRQDLQEEMQEMRDKMVSTFKKDEYGTIHLI